MPLEQRIPAVDVIVGIEVFHDQQWRRVVGRQNVMRVGQLDSVHLVLRLGDDPRIGFNFNPGDQLMWRIAPEMPLGNDGMSAAELILAEILADTDIALPGRLRMRALAALGSDAIAGLADAVNPR